MHTCYSPVRRSPAACCHAPLPLDLHVLGLSLAFILSQDQTLRCCIFVLCLFSLEKLVPSPADACRIYHTWSDFLTETKLRLPDLFLCTTSLLQSFQSSLAPPPFFRESDRKVTASFPNRKIRGAFLAFFNTSRAGARPVPLLRVQRYALSNYPPNFFATFF